MIYYFGSLLIAFADLVAFFFGLPLRAKAPPPPFECSLPPCWLFFAFVVAHHGEAAKAIAIDRIQSRQKRLSCPPS